uniref:Protein translocase subunit SecA n=1 Tax=Lutzomyia longipalpis TaxID=7200 RepID=A0A1B0C9P5_LUTLO
MKRNLANKNKKCQEGIIARDRQMKEEENVKNVGVIGLAERLLKGGELTLEHLIELGCRIAKKQGYEDDQIIVCDILSVKEKLEFKLYGKVEEIKNQNDMDILSLKVVETMMNHMKMEDLKKKNEFIEGFDNPKRTLFEWFKEKISKLRDQLFSLIQEDYEKIVGSDLDQLARDSEFKEAIKVFISNIPLLEEVDNFKNYQNLLSQFANMEENEDSIDPVKFKELQEKLEKAQNEILTKAKGVKVEVSANAKGEQELDIVKKFPEQMEKFTRIFEPLLRSEIDEKLNEKIREISEKLELDYEMLKGFFKAKQEEQQKDNESRANENSEDNGWSNLPEFKTNPCKDSNEKSLKQLLLEIQYDDTKSLEDDYKKVKNFSASWRNKKDVDIKNWAITQKGRLSSKDINEALAVMDRANCLATGGHELRDTQILALIVFLRTTDRGQLSQIQTGEGKTTIVAILAAIKALQGSKVDVITSNPVLAADGVKDKQRFFNLLSLSVTTNNFDPTYTTGERSCYKKDIVYGSIANFQFDYLKESFLGFKTRAGRPFDTIILDEVDSMIIDNANHIAKLSGPFPGMDALKYVYIKIWQELHKAERAIVVEFRKELKEKIEQLQKLPNPDEAQEEYRKFLNEMETSMIPRIKQSIKSSNPTAITLIPSHIREYADASVDRWIVNAIEAKFTYMEDQQYVIRNHNGELVVQPVDYANTGITMKNTIWQHGLHQFLQLKHNLQLTSESLTSCFISNLGYIKKYGSRIYGLTGTLGSESEQELLSSIYNVGFASIPTYREKKFEEIEGEVVDDDIFSQVIADDAIVEVEKGRSCLIICETIKDAKEIQEELIATGQAMRIRTFFDEENANATEEELSPGEVVIATNIAGRGTDFKTTDDLEKNGGLHVIVPFLPCNKRVEDQAFGRTARQGNEGTAKLIVKHVLKLNFQDNLFEYFADLYRNLKNENQFKEGYQSVLDDLKESWAFWLEKKNFTNNADLTAKDPKEEFEDFKSHASATINGQIKFNPYYAIQQADTFLSHEKYSDAERALNHAIGLSDNPEILHGAYMKLFEVEIEKGHKGRLSGKDINEALAVMDRANCLATGGHELRDTQILALIVFLRTTDRGQLSQIQTGEGKTTIVAILAAIKALQGSKVDVITSNPVLAVDGVKDKQRFFNLLSLSVTTNNFDPTYTTGERSCYKKDIVYGSIANFQFDYLKESFLGFKTRAGRPFDTIILDEVDSMIIDNANHIAKLSGPFPGMDALKYVYIKIWQELHKAERAIVEEFRKEMKEKIEQLQKLPNPDEAQEEYRKFLNEMETSMIPKIKQSIKSSNPTAITLIPSHIREYADASVDRWIVNAIEAKFTYMEDQQYVIRNHNGELVVQPVDYANTGITMKNTIWQHGLHQFLQLKHNLQLTSESLTSCFISNLGYIKKYGSRIYGLTGTLGSESEQELLSSIYNVGFASIPTYREKKFEEIEGEVVDDDIFSQVIADDAIVEVQKGRSCLIICETIKDAKEIQEELIATGQAMRIRTFFDEENANATEEELSPGEVVIATNIAGRGTDFKTTDDLEKNGGLHVIVPFLPCNKRVEDQAFGRTARQGNEGTAKLIVKHGEIEHLAVDITDLDYMKEIKEKRDLNEKKRIQRIKNDEVLKLNFQDNLFECFADLYRNLKNENQFKEGYQSVLDDLKESWAFWLEKKNFTNNADLTAKDPKEEFDDFKSHASATINGQIKFNPYYAIQQADTFLSHEKYSDAERALNHAIGLSDNPEILHGAYMKLFEVEIEKGHVFMDKCRQAIGDLCFITFVKPDGKYKENAKYNLTKAQEALKKELEYIEKLQKDEEFGYIVVDVDERKGDASYWYSDEDMNKIGTAMLKSLNIDPDKQFKNRLTKDLIEIFCKECKLQDKFPIFICYNISGTSNDGGGAHWVAMCVVKVQDQIKIFYKDSKGDFGGNIPVIKEEFRKHWKAVDFIDHPGIEQLDNTSCGPMTLENLRIMAKSIKDDGLEKFMKNFQNLTFSQQKDASKLRKEFLNNMADVTENLFLKHLTSRRAGLNLYVEHIKNLIERINNCKQGDGLSISLRSPDYFVNLKPKNENEKNIKKVVMDAELSELADVGTNTIYDLKEMYKVCDEVIAGARVQIIGGLGLIATGVAFPPALPVVGPIGGTMITEGVCDIAMDLIIQSSDGKFHKGAYIKGKVISYGISLLTMGISAAMQCPKILNKAKRACRWMAKTLRKCPYMKNICERIATKFDTIGKLFEKMEIVAKFNKMSNVEKLKYFNELKEANNLQHLKYLGENLKQINQLKQLEMAGRLTDLTRYQKTMAALKHIAMTTAKGIAVRTAQTVIITKIVTPQLSSMMEGFKPAIRRHVKKAVEENINREKLQRTNQEELQKVMQEIRDAIDYETILGIFRDAILGMSQHCSNWQVQLCALAIDQYVSWKRVYDFAKDLCKKINQKLKSSGDAKSNVDELIGNLTDQLTEEMYNHVVSNTIKTCRDVSSVGWKAFRNYKNERKKIQTCLDIIKEFKNGGVAGQEQATALSDVLKRPIHIYEENGNVIKIGEQYPGDPIEVSYHPPDENNPHGHYVPYGEDRNWSASDGSGNNCFFEAVGHKIETDANKLRAFTVNRMERHPRRYIAMYVRQELGSDGSHIFLQGGRNHIRMTDDYYPSHENRIKASNELNSEIAELRNKLNELKKKADQFKESGRSKQQIKKNFNKGHPKFGNVEDKEEMMMGAFYVKFTDGTELKLITVSGKTPFSDRQNMENPQDLDQTGQPRTFQWTTKRGFKFEDPGEPKGKVYDVYNRCETNQEFTTSCCAQKFVYILGEHMKNNPHLEIQDILRMNESWYKPGGGKFMPEQTQ